MAYKAQIKIRLTEELRQKIEKSAKKRGVSMNSEMIDRLSRSFENGDLEILIYEAVTRAIAPLINARRAA